MRRDRSGHAGAMLMRIPRRAERVVFVRDHAGEVGMAGIDLRIDHRYQNTVAIADAVRFYEMHFGNGVLRRRSIQLRWRLRLSEPVQPIWLRPENSAKRQHAAQRI